MKNKFIRKQIQNPKLNAYLCPLKMLTTTHILQFCYVVLRSLAGTGRKIEHCFRKGLARYSAYLEDYFCRHKKRFSSFPSFWTRSRKLLLLLRLGLEKTLQKSSRYYFVGNSIECQEKATWHCYVCGSMEFFCTERYFNISSCGSSSYHEGNMKNIFDDNNAWRYSLWTVLAWKGQNEQLPTM